MSRSTILLILKLVVFTLVFYAFCAFQTSFWPFVLGSFPSPQLWLIMVIFIALKWPNIRAVLFSYFLGLIMTRYSYIPLKMAWTSLVALMLFVWIFKNRIHSTSLFYFSILATSGSFFYAVAYILISRWLEPNPTPIFFLHRLLEMGCNFLFSIPIYKFLEFIDQRFESNPSWGPTTTTASTSSEVEP